jgi:hypothetical protein
MPQHHPLTITVNDQLTIDAGYWQECIEEDQTPYRLISPPQTAMYRQALSYLEEATKDMKAPAKSRLHFGEVAIATVAVCLRWGSYFAVLANHDLPQWTAAFDPEVSCIGDGEMARINIEASAALSDWIDLMQADQQRFRKLVRAAVQLLPFPIAHLDGSTYYSRFRALGAINSATGRRYLMEAFARDFGSEWLEREKARVLVHPTRALANGVLNEHWRFRTRLPSSPQRIGRWMNRRVQSPYQVRNRSSLSCAPSLWEAGVCGARSIQGPAPGSTNGERCLSPVSAAR